MRAAWAGARARDASLIVHIAAKAADMHIVSSSYIDVSHHHT